MPVVIYVVAILVALCIFCTWFFLSRFNDNKRKEKLLKELERIEEKKAVKQEEIKLEKKKNEELETFTLEKRETDVFADVEGKTSDNKKEEEKKDKLVPHDEEEMDDDDDDFEARFREYEKFLRERLMDDSNEDEEMDDSAQEKNHSDAEQEEDDDDDLSDLNKMFGLDFFEDDPKDVEMNSQQEDGERDKLMFEQRARKTTEKKEESTDFQEIKNQLNKRRKAENLPPLEDSQISVVSNKKEQPKQKKKVQVVREDVSNVAENARFTLEDVKAIKNFDMESVKGLSVIDIENILLDLPPNARQFLLTEILKEREGEEE